MGNGHGTAAKTKNKTDVDPIAERHFPYSGKIFGDPQVYIPIWNGRGDIFSIQKVFPDEVPTHPIPEGFPLPGETIQPKQVPSELYTLTATDPAAYAPAGENGDEYEDFNADFEGLNQGHKTRTNDAVQGRRVLAQAHGRRNTPDNEADADGKRESGGSPAPASSSVTTASREASGTKGMMAEQNGSAARGRQTAERKP